MSELNFKVGQTVQIARRNITGRIAFVGLTNFSPGKWIGVELDEDKGRNNGVVNGICYFKCPAKRGLFVRPTQLLIVSAATASAATVTMNEAPAAVTTAAEEEQSVVEELTAAAPTPASSNNDAPSCSSNLLKTTKIIQPKQAKQFLSSSSQLSLHVVASTSSSCSKPSNNSTSIQPATIVAVQPLAPKRSKTSVSPSDSFCCSKRAASFVETGFLEILHPKFTPGHPQRSATFSMSTSSVKLEQQQQKQREMEEKLSELTEEIENLRRQKGDDKRKLHELEKVRLQNEQLLEFKSKIMEQHSMLQRELQRSRQESRDANDVKCKYKRELDELAEGIEMLTLDKEMAEEKADTLQIELELAQERIEELTLDVEILRAENEEYSLPMVEGNSCRKVDNLPTAGELKKMEQYNQRLRETVVRLRDVLTQEKQNLQKSTKELETKYSEISELTKTKQILSQRVDMLEVHIIDLKEQVDAALGAESMVESLAEAKLELEERVKLLEEEVAELEALEEIHEQLVESNQELEVDLREEIELLNVAIKTLQHEKDNALETVYDRDLTIKKFRELVKNLNEQFQLKDITATSLSDDFSTISNQDEQTEHSIDFNQVFSLTKAYGRTIDAQLNAVELKLSEMHIEYLLAFVSEDFMFRGREHDVILVLLLLNRINEKVEILCNAINEKFPSTCEFGRDGIFEGYSVHRFAFRSRSIYFLRSLKLVLQQLIFGLNHCDYEVCQHAAIYRVEIETQESLVDDMLRMLKRALLDENSSIEPIERMLSFFNALYTNLIIPQDMAQLVDEHQLYLTLVDVFDMGLDCANTNAELLHTIIQLGDEQTETFWVMQFLIESMSDLKQKLRKLHRKLPASSVTFNGMQREQVQRIQMTNEHFGRLINILASSTRDATKDLTAAHVSPPYSSNDIAIDHEKLWRIISLNLSKTYRGGGEEFKSPNAMFERCVQLIDEQISEFNAFMKVDETVRNTNMNTVFVRSSASTLLQRSAEVKQQFDDVKVLRQALLDRDKEIKTLKYIAKMKQNDFSEMQIRKEIAERNQTKSLNEQLQTLTNFSLLVESLEQQLRSKDVTFSKAIDTFDSKLNKLEQTLRVLHDNFQVNTEAVNTSTNVSCKEIHMLSNCLRRERSERTRLQFSNLKTKFKSLEPIVVPQRSARSDIRKLENQLRELKNDWILSHVVIKSNSKSTIAVRCNNLTRHIMDTYFRGHPHRAVPCDFSKFPTSDIRSLVQLN